MPNRTTAPPGLGQAPPSPPPCGLPELHCLACLLLPVGIVGLLLMLQARGLDLASHYAALRAAEPGTRAVLKLFTDWGNPVFYAVYAGLLWTGWRQGRRDLTRFAWTYLAVQLAVSFALVRLLKIGLGCPRPGVGGPEDLAGLCIPLSFDAAHNALPSGHTVELTGALLPLAMRAGSWLLTPLLGCYLGLMAYSRVYLGWHHPEDVAFGLALGCFAAWLIHSYGR